MSGYAPRAALKRMHRAEGLRFQAIHSDADNQVLLGTAFRQNAPPAVRAPHNGAPPKSTHKEVFELRQADVPCGEFDGYPAIGTTTFTVTRWTPFGYSLHSADGCR